MVFQQMQATGAAGRRIPFRMRVLSGTAAAACLAAAMLVLPAPARVVLPADDQPAEAQFLQARLSHAFRAGDHELLVSYLHPDGAQIALGPTVDRASLMTPAQAHYYFKNLFQARRTASFEFLRQHRSQPDRMHAMAAWRWERTDGGPPAGQRLLFAMVYHDGYWRVTEITAVRGD